MFVNISLLIATLVRLQLATCNNSSLSLRFFQHLQDVCKKKSKHILGTKLQTLQHLSDSELLNHFGAFQRSFPTSCSIGFGRFHRLKVGSWKLDRLMLGGNVCNIHTRNTICIYSVMIQRHKIVRKYIVHTLHMPYLICKIYVISYHHDIPYKLC